MSCVVFKNDGEIDLRLISTFGCSVKETDNPIGFFGTGLKYAIAVLLRTGHEIEIHIGLRRFTIGSRAEEIRGKSFDLVFAKEQNGSTIELGFTTELGKNWEVWMAYRELHCNAKDEKAGAIESISEFKPDERGKTRIYVTGNALFQVHQDRRDYILDAPADFMIGKTEVINKPSKSIFYKGIRVMDLKASALFTYNLKSDITLTEDRTVRDSNDVRFLLSRDVLGYGEKRFLEKILTAKAESYESSFDFHGGGTEPSAEFFATVDSLQRSELMKVNSSALRLWKEKCKGVLNPRRINPTSVQFEMLQKAIEFCEKAGFELKGQYPIFIVETLGGDGVMAACDTEGKQIFLTREIFDSGGTKGVAESLD